MSSTTLRARVALAEMEALGLTIEDLLAVAAPEAAIRPPRPTLRDYVPVVAAAYPSRTRRTYNSYWRLAVEFIGDVAIERVTVDDLLRVTEEAARRAAIRRAGSDGRASRESCVAALRAVFGRAHKAGLISSNPALLVDKPRRLENRRRALTQAELDDLWVAVAATTKDPELELLLLRFHLESGTRRMGAINLRLRDLDRGRQTAWLHEKPGPSASSRSAQASLRPSLTWRPNGGRAPQRTRRLLRRTAALDARRLSPTGSTTESSAGPSSGSPGHPRRRSPPTSCDTRPSRLSSGSPGLPWPPSLRATGPARSLAPTPRRTSPRSLEP